MFQLKKTGFIFAAVLAVLLLFSCNAKEENKAAVNTAEPNESNVEDIAEVSEAEEHEDTLLAEEYLKKIMYNNLLEEEEKDMEDLKPFWAQNISFY